MPNETRGVPEESWFKKHKRKIAGAVLGVGLGVGAMESGRVGVKKAAAEADEQHQIERKKMITDVGSKMNKNVFEHQTAHNNVEKSDDVVGKNFSAASEFLENNQVVDYSFNLEAREDIDGNLNCDVYQIDEQGKKEDSGLRISINNDGTYTIKSFSGFDQPSVVNSLEDLARAITNRNNYKVLLDQYHQGTYSKEVVESFGKDWGFQIELPAKKEARDSLKTELSKDDLKKAADMFVEAETDK